MSRHSFGTDIRRDISAKLLGQAVAAPGLDQRYWCSLGTVCTVDPETGKKDPTDSLAIYNDSAGVDVDVELEPLGQPVTCKYAGVQAGEVTVCAPIRPGDIVLVECPDGDLYTPVITKILHSRSHRQPTDQGRPIFDNNRLLIHAASVPIDIRLAGTDGMVQVLIEQDGTVTTTAKKIKLGGTDATEPLELGQTRNTAETEFLTDAAAAAAALEAAATADSTLSSLTGGFTDLGKALTTFLGKLDTFLSKVSVTK
jgi:hypothetical protein